MNKLIIVYFVLYVFLRLCSIGTAQEIPELVLPTGHSAPITAVAFSPDGEYVASASEDTTIRLWELKTGREIRNFLGHEFAIYSIAFSSDGRYLISSHCAGRGSYLPTGKNIRIWDVKTGKQLFCIPGQKGVYSVDISSDDKYILSGSYCVMNLWDRNTGKELMSFSGHNHSALRQVEQEARPEDVFIFYYSGHGTMNEDDTDFYFVLHDVTNLSEGHILEEKGLSATYLRNMSQSIKATKQLIIIDSCQSGKATERFKGGLEEKAIAQLARSAGVTVISATQSEQVAVEIDKIKHGLFTYALLRGIRGEADGSPKDNRITVNELCAYIQAVIPELTREHLSKPQYPNVFMRGQDFPIVMKK